MTTGDSFKNNRKELVGFLLFFISVNLYFSSVDITYPLLLLLFTAFISFSHVLNPPKFMVIILFIFVILNYVYSTLVLDYSNFQYQSVLHVLLLLSFAFFTRVRLSNESLSFVILIFILFNLFLVVFGSISEELYEKIYHIESSGFIRYKGLLKEPSYNAIVLSVLFFARLSLPEERKYYNLLQLFFLVMFMLISVSGTGICLFSIAMLLSQSGANNKRFALIISIFISILLLVFMLSFPDIYNYVSDRAARVITGDVDESTFLRFFAPIKFVTEVWKEYPVLGVGIANLEEYILRNSGTLSFLAKYNNNFNTNIDNGFIFWLSTTGLFGGIVLLFTYILNWIFLCNKDFKTVIFHSSILFFTGSFINPVYLYSLVGSYAFIFKGKK